MRLLFSRPLLLFGGERWVRGKLSEWKLFKEKDKAKNEKNRHHRAHVR